MFKRLLTVSAMAFSMTFAYAQETIPATPLTPAAKAACACPEGACKCDKKEACAKGECGKKVEKSCKAKKCTKAKECSKAKECKKAEKIQKQDA